MWIITEEGNVEELFFCVCVFFLKSERFLWRHSEAYLPVRGASAALC